MTPRRTMLIAALAGVGVTVLFFLFLLSPKLAEIRDTQERIEAERRQADLLTNEIRRLEEIRREAPRTTARLATVSNYLPSSPTCRGSSGSCKVRRTAPASTFVRSARALRPLWRMVKASMSSR